VTACSRAADPSLCFLAKQPSSAPTEALVIVEIPKDGREKNEIDPRTGELVVDRVLPDSLGYPAAYGVFPCTLAGDGDPLDVLVLTDSFLPAGSRLRVRPIGVLRMVDAGEQDDKLFAVPLSSSLREVPLDVQQTIQRFFSIYKPGADIQLNGWADSTVAARLLGDAIADR
jgi:inorganic pyrophosphatase